MEKLENYINSHAGRNLKQLFHLVHIWNRAVGQNIAENSRPIHLKGGVMSVTVCSSMWLQELTLMKPALLSKIQSIDDAIIDIRFVHRPYKVKSVKKDDERLLPIDEQKARFIKNLSSQVKNEELRQSLEKTLTAYFKRYSAAEFLDGVGE